MRAFDIGLSALRAQQQTLSVLGNNLANASTPGYHRQRVELVDRIPLQNEQLQIGSGVDVAKITRLRNSAVETALLRNASEAGSSQQTLEIMRHVESLLTPGDASVHASLSLFFNRLEKVANAPQDLTVRNEFLSSAAELIQSFNSIEGQMTSLARDVRLDLDGAVREVNQLLADIAGLNQRIFQARATGSEPNDILDRRDSLVTKLAEFVEVETVTRDNGSELVVLAGGALSVGNRPLSIRAKTFTDGTVGLTISDSSTPIPLNSGKLEALTSALNETLPEFKERLVELSRQIIRAVDQQHATGISDQGPYSVLQGSRSVDDVSVPLSKSNPEFPITTGDFYITTTDSAGIRRTQKVSVDPATESLTDVATKLDALPGIAANVDTVRRTLRITAEGGYSIDFTGRPDNVPDLSAMTGTSRPEFSGLYSGTINDEWTASFSGAGTIGVTPGLTLTMRDQAGQIIGTKDVGAGYEAGTPFEIRDGVFLNLGSGTVTAADSFSLKVINSPDETGILSALGINSLFGRSETGVLTVRSDLLQNPERLASSVTGFPGDALNVAAMAKLRDVRIDALGGRTFVEELSDVTAESGLEVETADSQNIQIQSFRQRLETDRDALSGVDINEEMLEMMQAERAYQGAAKYLSTVDQMLDELFRLVR